MWFCHVLSNHWELLDFVAISKGNVMLGDWGIIVSIKPKLIAKLDWFQGETRRDPNNIEQLCCLEHVETFGFLLVHQLFP